MIRALGYLAAICNVFFGDIRHEMFLLPFQVTLSVCLYHSRRELNGKSGIIFVDVMHYATADCSAARDDITEFIPDGKNIWELAIVISSRRLSLPYQPHLSTPP